MVKFLVVKSYDGGRSWHRDQVFGDFVAAAEAARSLRTEHPYIRFRVEPEAVGRRCSPGQGRPVG